MSIFPFCVFATVWLTEIPLSSTYSNGNPWLGWSGRWTDGPLTVDRSLTYAEGRYNQAQVDDFATTIRQIAGYGCLDGLTYNADRRHFHQYIAEYVRKGTLPAGFSAVPNYQFVNGLEDEPHFAAAITNAAALRIGGKTLITSYRTDRHKPADLKAKLDWLRKKYGDKFLFIASVMPFSQTVWNDFRMKEGRVPEAERARVKDKLREYLRVADGLGCELYNHCAINPVDGERTLDAGLFADCVQAYRELLDEPEFAGKKLFTVNVGPGHANSYTFGNRNSSNGTRTLRRSIETALKFRPDILLFFEWDEWNENTSVKPTLWNSFSAMRILRAERALSEKRPNEPVTGDDPSVPNLVLSFRKTLVLGEIARYEVLAVPDTATKGLYEVSLAVKDETGRTVKTFGRRSLAATQLKDVRFDFPSELAGNAYALVPELTVKWNGRSYVYSDGLPFTELRATTTWDRKWVSMPLRDLAANATCGLESLDGAESGKVRVRASASLPAGIDRLEVLDGGEIVSSLPGDPAEDFRDDARHVVFSCWNTLGIYTKKNAQISVSGVTEAEWLVGTNRTSGLSRTVTAQSLYTPDTYLRLRRDEAERAKVTLTWPESGSLEIPVAPVLAFGIYALNGPTNGLLFAVRRYAKQPYFMSPVGRPSAETTVDVRPDLPVAVLGAHAIAADGKICRSKPVVVGRRSGEKTKVRVYSVAMKRPVEIDVDRERVPVLRYDITPRATGTAVLSQFGRAFDASLGAPPSRATLRNRGCSSFAHCSIISEGSRKLPCWAPQVVPVGQVRPGLRFDGTGTYFALPHGALPQNAAYRLSFDFKPVGTGVGMEVFSCGTSKIWSNLGRLFVDKDGTLSGAYVSQWDYKDTSLKSAGKVLPDAWNSVEVICDVASFELILNGRSSGKVPCTMPARYDSNCWFGGRGGSLFKGDIRNIRISHGLSN